MNRESFPLPFEDLFSSCTEDSVTGERGILLELWFCLQVPALAHWAYDLIQHLFNVSKDAKKDDDLYRRPAPTFHEPAFQWESAAGANLPFPVGLTEERLQIMTSRHIFSFKAVPLCFGSCPTPAPNFSWTKKNVKGYKASGKVFFHRMAG